MMLSAEDIRNYLAEGSLVVEPFHESCIRISGLSLHLGEQVLKQLPGKVVDVLAKIIPDYEEHILTMEKPYPLSPGEFVLAHTLESVTVPQKLGLLIEGRSTLARVGLTVVQTAMIVDPGHRARSITLELANNGPNTILLYPRMKIARAALFEFKTPPQEPYDRTGKYRNQKAVGRPVFEREFLEEWMAEQEQKKG
jgi:dCTP deaminase